MHGPTAAEFASSSLPKQPKKLVGRDDQRSSDDEAKAAW